MATDAPIQSPARSLARLRLTGSPLPLPLKLKTPRPPQGFTENSAARFIETLSKTKRTKTGEMLPRARCRSCCRIQYSLGISETDK
eukprot:1192185-Prorocentrum_minimum.AAC.1